MSTTLRKIMPTDEVEALPADVRERLENYFRETEAKQALSERQLVVNKGLCELLRIEMLHKKRLPQEKHRYEYFDSVIEILAQKNRECVILRIRQLELELGEKVEEFGDLRLQMSKMKNSLEQDEEKIEYLSEMIRYSKETYMQSQEQFQGRVEEMQKLLQEETESRHREARDGDKEKRAGLDQLRQELERANRLLSTSKFPDSRILEALFNTVCNTSDFLKIVRYHNEARVLFVEILNDLIKERGENQMLRRQLQENVTELEKLRTEVDEYRKKRKVDTE